jgi:three-Cys-motif partner protein
MKKSLNKVKQEFGGSWTEQKLKILAKYLAAYTKILSKKTQYKFYYLDAFAGTGYREIKEPENPNQVLFPELIEGETRAFLDGSAKVALGIEPQFHNYVFIERDPARCAELEKLRAEDKKPDRIIVRNQEANDYLLKLCQANWDKHRAVLFLDPFGLQVKWSTLEAIAKTKAIDVWILFPLGSGVNRLLKRNGQIDPNHRRILDDLFGCTDWFEEFYKFESEPDLFGGTATKIRKSDLKSIGAYFVKRLSSIFAGVAEPMPLLNAKNNPLFLFCFAAGNSYAAKTAVKIANDIIVKELRKGQ